MHCPTSLSRQPIERSLAFLTSCYLLSCICIHSFFHMACCVAVLIKEVIKKLPVIAERTINVLPIKKSENKCNELPAKMLIATINEAPELIPRT